MGIDRRLLSPMYRLMGDALTFFGERGQTYKNELIAELEDGHITTYGQYFIICNQKKRANCNPHSS